ncbi:MAG: cation transporter [Candidatus Competibacteraceae bacterium]|nr:cation transporter [Candidatus Competibacteraceae bacterium]
MPTSTPIADWRHTHIFDEGNPLAERNTRWAVVLTAIMMVAEIAGGWVFNSMALLADGWHMGSHALALGLSVLAYGAARRFAPDQRFAFGTWKIEVLGGYTSAIFLVGVAALMLYQAIEAPHRANSHPLRAGYRPRRGGPLVNLARAWLLKDGQAHHHAHDHAHDRPHGHSSPTRHHRDLNLRSAYLHHRRCHHVRPCHGGAGWRQGWGQPTDPVMGIIGAGLVAGWAWGCCAERADIARCRDGCPGGGGNPRGHRDQPG